MFVAPNVYPVYTQKFGRRLSLIEALKISVIEVCRIRNCEDYFLMTSRENQELLISLTRCEDYTREKNRGNINYRQLGYSRLFPFQFRVEHNILQLRKDVLSTSQPRLRVEA